MKPSIKVLFFGPLTELVGRKEIDMAEVEDTKSLIEKLTNDFPALADAKYVVAVNKKIISGNTVLTQGSTAALLPPFSGG